MRYIYLSLIAVITVTLNACVYTESDSGSDPVTDFLFDLITNPSNVVVEIENGDRIAPAQITFVANSQNLLASYQWTFSDENHEAKTNNQTQRVTHTFEEPGIYEVYVRYRTNGGVAGEAKKTVVVAGGSLSGNIFAAVNNLVDVDTRDFIEPSADNDSFENAQVISSTTLLSGIVDSNDPVDFYQVQLQESQRLMVQIADSDSNTDSYDLVKLSLYTSSTDDSPIIKQTDTVSGRFDSALLVPSSGNYFIKIEAENPSSANIINTVDHGIYTLSINAARASSSAEFALGEVNVLLKPDRQYMAQGVRTQMDLGRFKNLSLDDARALMASANITYSSFSRFSSSVASSANQTAAQATLQQQRWEVLQAVEILSQHDDIEIAEPNWRRYPFVMPAASATPAVNDPFYASQWHYDTINLPQAWQELGAHRGAGVVVAVLDTGVLTGHPDLANNLIAGYDYVGDGTRGSHDNDANDPGDKSINEQRSSFHGTHVAGTIGAVANDKGGIGVAPDVQIMPVRVLGKGGGFSSDIIAGVCFAAQLQKSTQAGCGNTNTAVQSADVINLSLGGVGYSQIEQGVYNAVMNKGIIVIAAAGNEATSDPFYPAAYNGIISVAAISQTLEQSNYSNFGSTIDVAAPGGDLSKDSGIMSTWGDDRTNTTMFTYGSLQGTSMAAPHVAGIAALMKSVKPSLTHTDFLGYLNAGELTQDLGVAGRDNIYGYGLINAHKAVLLAKGGATPQLLSSSNQLFFNVSQSSLSFTLTTNGVGSGGEGDLTVTVQDAPWLSVQKETDAGASSENSVGLGSNIVTVNRDGMNEGRYEGQLLIESTVLPDLLIAVILQIGNSEVSANAGVQYVLLIDENAEAGADGATESAAGSSALLALDGQYSYEITGLKKGRYIVATGSDLDFDNIICDSGESCGQYPTLDSPKVITISEEQAQYTNVNMSVSYVDITSTGSTASMKPDPETKPAVDKGFNGYKKPSARQEDDINSDKRTGSDKRVSKTLIQTNSDN